MKGTLETNKAETPMTYDSIFTLFIWDCALWGNCSFFGVDIKLSTWISVHTLKFSSCHPFYLMVQEKKKKKGMCRSITLGPLKQKEIEGLSRKKTQSKVVPQE